ncbi:helix-turn-helix transcriptional regulator [Streptomyces sp. NPDC004539]|uniref:helix-turn-helix domain-containing protein n=1 Tax=Streptomyces sp. NPDC004539 TaxID=3154280 RepID=UPI0033B72A83
MARRGDLGEFIRSRRERITPQEVGLRSSGRRRTPGLRREELAILAGVSVDYLIRLEQGKDSNPSSGVLNGLSDALRLTAEERKHLTLLATDRAAAESLPKSGTHDDDVRPTTRVLVERLGSTPACVLGPAYDVLAWNGPWEALTRLMGIFDEDPPNLVRYIFVNTKARQFIPRWDMVADEAVGWMRVAGEQGGSDNPRWRDVLAGLLELPEFAARWVAHPVAPIRSGSKQIRHPEFGDVNLGVEVLTAAPKRQYVFAVLTEDEKSEKALQEILAGPLQVLRPA